MGIYYLFSYLNWKGDKGDLVRDGSTSKEKCRIYKNNGSYKKNKIISIWLATLHLSYFRRTKPSYFSQQWIRIKINNKSKPISFSTKFTYKQIDEWHTYRERDVADWKQRGEDLMSSLFLLFTWTNIVTMITWTQAVIILPFVSL